LIHIRKYSSAWRIYIFIQGIYVNIEVIGAAKVYTLTKVDTPTACRDSYT